MQAVGNVWLECSYYPPRRTSCIDALSWSSRSLSPHFQFSLSAAGLGMYLYGPLPLPPCGFISFRVVSNCGCSTTPLQRWWRGGEVDRNIKLQQNWLSSLHVSVQLTEVYRQICSFSGYLSHPIWKIIWKPWLVFERDRYIWPRFGLWGLCFREMDSLYSIGICLVIVIISISSCF